MLLIDFNAICIATVMVQKDSLDYPTMRHMILNSIRMHTTKHKDKYGLPVICCDSHSWRKNVYPEYKANRKRDPDDVEGQKFWSMVYETINGLIDDIRANFPYKVVKVEGAEADDIIGVLVEQTQEFGKHEDVMIISGDKDFAQLQKYPNVAQYSPVQKKFIKEKHPRKFLVEHIIKGDSSDGIPNVLSTDDTFVAGKRQTQLRAKKIEEIMAGAEAGTLTDEIGRNYMRNKRLIDLSQTPVNIQQEIINTYESHTVASRSKVLPYLIAKRHNLLIECVDEFL